MTTFESILLLAVTASVIITAFGVLVIKKMLKEIIDRQYANWEQLRKIETHANFLADISQQLDNIEDNNDEDFEKLTDIVDKMHRNLCVEIADKMVDRIYPDKESMNKIDWDKLSKEQQDEFLKRIILPNYDNPTQPIYTPCYTPDGICMNPHRDCINCPKRGTGGTWTTSTNKINEN